MMTDRIFAPNLYLCAYHLRKDDTEGETHPLWSNCDRLLSHLTETRLIPHLHHGENRTLLPPPKKQISFTLPNFKNMEGFFQPVQLQEDSYGVFLNIGYDDSNPANTVAIPVLEQFNPNQILPFPPSPYFLGQTLLLTLNLTPENQGLKGAKLTELANQCYQALFNQKVDSSRSRELFGSPIFEYGNPRELDKSPHVLIWLFRDKNADETLGKCFQLTFDLFFYRHKVSKAFQDSREIYKQLKQYYLSLDSILDEIQIQLDTAKPDPQNTTYLQNLKTQLKQLSADSLIYDRLLRKMKDFGTTININLNNYNDTIERICAKLGTDKEELSFWRYFGEETGPYFQGQIAANLSYFEQGTGLISQAITSIRAIVEIDQAQCDRQRQKIEEDSYKEQQDANQDLQDHIQAVGVGIAAGAIVASTSGLMTQPWYLPNGQKIEVTLIPHPLWIGLFFSFVCSLGAWWIAQNVIQKRRLSTITLKNHPVWQNLSELVNRLDVNSLALAHLKSCDYTVSGYSDECDRLYEKIILPRPLLPQIISSGVIFKGDKRRIQLKFTLNLETANPPIFIAQLMLVYDENLDFIDENWQIDLNSELIKVQA